MPPLGDFLTPDERQRVQAEALRQFDRIAQAQVGVAIGGTPTHFIQTLWLRRLTPLDRQFLKSIRVKAD